MLLVWRQEVSKGIRVPQSRSHLWADLLSHQDLLLLFWSTVGVRSLSHSIPVTLKVVQMAFWWPWEPMFYVTGDLLDCSTFDHHDLGLPHPSSPSCKCLKFVFSFCIIHPGWPVSLPVTLSLGTSHIVEFTSHLVSSAPAKGKTHLLPVVPPPSASPFPSPQKDRHIICIIYSRRG